MQNSAYGSSECPHDDKTGSYVSTESAAVISFSAGIAQALQGKNKEDTCFKEAKDLGTPAAGALGGGAEFLSMSPVTEEGDPGEITEETVAVSVFEATADGDGGGGGPCGEEFGKVSLERSSDSLSLLDNPINQKLSLSSEAI